MRDKTMRIGERGRVAPATPRYLIMIGNASA